MRPVLLCVLSAFCAAVLVGCGGGGGGGTGAPAQTYPLTFTYAAGQAMTEGGTYSILARQGDGTVVMNGSGSITSTTATGARTTVGSYQCFPVAGVVRFTSGPLAGSEIADCDWNVADAGGYWVVGYADDAGNPCACGKLLVLPNPLTVGATFQQPGAEPQTASEGRLQSAAATVAGIENVVLPGGTLRAARIAYSHTATDTINGEAVREVVAGNYWVNAERARVKESSTSTITGLEYGATIRLTIALTQTSASPAPADKAGSDAALPPSLVLAAAEEAFARLK